VGFGLSKDVIKKEINKNRAVIGQAAQEMLDMVSSGELENQNCPVTHRFADNCYLREIFMPKGTLIIGKIHATQHFNVILKGDVTVLTATGVERLSAPYTFISEAGTQKVVAVHSDCIWQTLHVTDSKDLDEIESQVIVEDHDDLSFDGLIEKHLGGLLCRGD